MSRPTSTESGRHVRTDTPPAMKTVIALFLAAAAGLLLAAVPRRVEAQGPYDPVDLATRWDSPVIIRAIAGEHASCYPDGAFRPDSTIARAEFVKLLVDAVGLP